MTFRAPTCIWMKTFESLVEDDGDFLHNSCSINKLLNTFNDIFLRDCNEI